jgi:SAM-dependent methyltransferase
MAIKGLPIGRNALAFAIAAYKCTVFVLSAPRRPSTPNFGFGLGTPIDRYYVEEFLSKNSHLISGRVMEIGDSRYSDMFGQSIRSLDVLHVDLTNPRATLIGDLLTGRGVPQDSFDAIICTQTLHCLEDPVAGLKTLENALVPGGVLLATLPLLAQISRFDMDNWGDYWRFTSKGVLALFGKIFGKEITMSTYGNFRSATALLNGVPAGFLTKKTLGARDIDYEVLIGVLATKPKTKTRKEGD